MSDLHPWQALPCNDFIDWLDRTYRVHLVNSVLNADRRLAELQANESWNRLLLHVYHGGITGERWGTEAHLVAWCYSWTRKDAWFLVSNECQARGIVEGRERKTMYLLSELEAEQLDQVMACVDRTQTEPQDIGPSAPGWFDQLIDGLTERQRQSVELTLLGDWEPSQAAAYLGVKPTHIRSAKHSAILSMKNKITHGRVDVPGYTAATA